jgi:hypothetical protein
MAVKLVAVGAQHGPHVAEAKTSHLGAVRKRPGRHADALAVSPPRQQATKAPDPASLRLGAARCPQERPLGALLAPDLQGAAFKG